MGWVKGNGGQIVALSGDPAIILDMELSVRDAEVKLESISRYTQFHRLASTGKPTRSKTPARLPRLPQYGYGIRMFARWARLASPFLYWLYSTVHSRILLRTANSLLTGNLIPMAASWTSW